MKKSLSQNYKDFCYFSTYFFSNKSLFTNSHFSPFSSNYLFQKSRNLYSVLGIQKNSSKEDISKAFKNLAKKFHPDVNKSDPKANEKFSEINQAYQILSDEKKRKIYDLTGSAEAANSGQFTGGPETGGAGGGGSSFFYSSGGGGAGVFEEFFKSFGGFGPFGGGENVRNYPIKGRDIQKIFPITLQQAYYGLETEISIPKYSNCGECGGSGIDEKKSKTCSECKGKGIVESFGKFHVQKICPSCGGKGVQVSPCQKCSGSGYKTKIEKVSISIPQGVDEGFMLKFPGYGEPGMNSGPSGDLYIEIEVKPSKNFKRRSERSIFHPSSSRIHLVTESNIPLGTAILGGKINVEHLTGEKLEIDIPAGTQYGEEIVVKNKGMKDFTSKKERFGNLYVKAKIEIPKKLSSEQKKLIEKAFLKEKSDSETKKVSENLENEKKKIKTEIEEEFIENKNDKKENKSHKTMWEKLFKHKQPTDAQS